MCVTRTTAGIDKRQNGMWFFTLQMAPSIFRCARQDS